VQVLFFQIVKDHGGASHSLVEVARRLQAHAGVEVVDVYGECPAFAQDLERAGVPRRVLLPGGDLQAVGSRHQPLRRLARLLGTVPHVLRIQKAAERLLGELRPDVVISNDFRSLLPLALSRKLRQVALVAYCRGWWTPDMLAAYSRWIARRRCAAVIAVSRPTKLALACAGIDAAKIHVVPNPIDAEAFSALADRPLSAEVPQANRPVRLLMPATVIRSKGQLTAIRALRRIVDAGQDPVLWLAGDLSPVTESYVRECNRLADSLGVAGRVEWLGLRDDVPQLMKASTIVVLPSHSEGHPRVSLESAAASRPLVGTPVGGMTDMILHRVTGMLHEVGDETGMARAVLDLVEDPALVARIVQNARCHVQECLRPEQQTQALLSILRTVIGEPPGAAS
jgi:glycosyltransferase involved in cell wall biosynthesis